jgi:hypothetical protein
VERRVLAFLGRIRVKCSWQKRKLLQHLLQVLRDLAEDGLSDHKTNLLTIPTSALT